VSDWNPAREVLTLPITVSWSKLALVLRDQKPMLAGSTLTLLLKVLPVDCGKPPCGSIRYAVGQT